MIISYSGFSAPCEVDVDNLVLMSNYLGDVTEEFLEYYKDIMDTWDYVDIVDNQPFDVYGLWYAPTVEMLMEFNKSVGLSEWDYLEEVTI